MHVMTRRLDIDAEACVGCGACLKVCPYAALMLANGKAHVNDQCIFCGACVESCPFEAIHLYRPQSTQESPIPETDGVWVFGEQIEGEIQPVVLELISAGRRLADALGEPLAVVVCGHDMDAACRNLLDYPVDLVLQVDAPELMIYRPEPYAEQLASLIRDRRPSIVLGGATAIGRSLLARVAVSVRTGITADCTDLAITDDGHLLQTRPAFGGNIMASILCSKHRPQMATVRHGVLEPAAPANRNGRLEVVPEPTAAASIRTRRLAFLRDQASAVNLAEAELIVSGGRGLGSSDSVHLLETLADKLNGAVGASRGAVEAGWLPYSQQIGQTGKTVKPRVYIACGISGAVQHQVGMASSDIIVAINNDPAAPIFDIATYGIVGDVHTILPALIEAL